MVGIVISDDVRTSYVEDLSISLVGATVGFCILITLETRKIVRVVTCLCMKSKIRFFYSVVHSGRMDPEACD